MSHPATTGMTASSADTPRSRVAYYRDMCRLDATVKPETGRIVVHAGPLLSAFTLPSGIAVRIKAKLKQVNGRHGPIIAHPRSNRWTFLADPVRFDDADLTVYASMFRINVSIAPSGAEIMLPSPADLQIAYRLWETLPPNGFRPRAGDVLDAVRDCFDIKVRH